LLFHPSGQRGPPARLKPTYRLDIRAIYLECAV
jgi:hypothetical protein